MTSFMSLVIFVMYEPSFRSTCDRSHAVRQPTDLHALMLVDIEAFNAIQQAAWAWKSLFKRTFQKPGNSTEGSTWYEKVRAWFC